MTQPAIRRAVRTALLAATVMIAAAVVLGEMRRTHSVEALGSACAVPVSAEPR